MTEVPEPRRAGSAQSEGAGFGWNDSSWDLMRGLDVVEDLPLDAWALDALSQRVCVSA
ncbi:MAG: hypothetical protein ABI605_00470 [Rhizobacter sp.]